MKSMNGKFNLVAYAIVVLLLTSCKISTAKSEHYESFDPSKSYKLGLAPDSGSRYYFLIKNETSIKSEFNDKKTDNINKTTNGVYYTIDRDSTGNFIFHVTYDSIHVYSKNKDSETELDMINASTSSDPVENLLGILKDAKVTATISPKGEIKEVHGYDEMTEKIMESFTNSDRYTKELAMQKWRQLIDQGIIKKNMEQLFKLFPDSAIRIGDQWKLSSHSGNDIGMNLKSIYTLKTMNSQFTLIEAEGKLTSDTSSINVMGYEVLAKLDGSQHSEYQLETKTGMLISSSVKANFEGKLEVMGKEIPVKIYSVLSMEGKKVK